MILLKADARHIPLRDESVQCVVTSPPYWGLRSYEDQGDRGIGLERTPEEYVANIVQVFREVKRVLRSDGTVWLNMGDSYSTRMFVHGYIRQSPQLPNDWKDTQKAASKAKQDSATTIFQEPPGLKPKDLVGIPWRVAFALQADGWYLRSDIIWAKPNPMPESVRDRPTKAHEYVFLLSKSQRYYYDNEAIKERCDERNIGRRRGTDSKVPSDCKGELRTRSGLKHGQGRSYATRNARTVWGLAENRVVENDAEIQDKGCEEEVGGIGEAIPESVWEIATQPFPGAHFATFPEELAERCIKAGSKPGDVVLDPFGGSGTVARVAVKLRRRAVHLDLAYHELAKNSRCTQIQMSAL